MGRKKKSSTALVKWVPKRKLLGKGAKNFAKTGMTAKDFIVKQAPTMPAKDVVAAGKKLGLEFSTGQVNAVRKKAGIVTPFQRRSRVSMLLANKALTLSAKSTRDSDKIIKALVAQAAFALGKTNIHRLTIDIRTREYRMAYEHEERGTF